MAKMTVVSNRYPLKTPWTMWTNKICILCSSNYNDTLTKIYKFDSVISFWQLINNMPKISELANGIKYRMFRHDIKPAAEDVANGGGGSWTFHINVSIFDMKREKHADNIWEKLMMSIIGGKLYGDLDSYINGICCGLKGNNMYINLWISACEPEQIMKIGKKMKEIMMGDEEFMKAIERNVGCKFISPLMYQDHTSRYSKSINKKRKYKRSRYKKSRYNKPVDNGVKHIIQW